MAATVSGAKTDVRYRLTIEGQGGLLTFDYPPLIPWVGTYGCITCVGVYFEIDQKRAFLAHINAWHVYPAGRTNCRARPDHGQQLQRLVLEQLRKNAIQGNYDPWKIDKSSVIVVCPKPDDGKLQPKQLTGWYIIKAIEEFLAPDRSLFAVGMNGEFIRRLSPPKIFLLSRHEGFLVNHTTGERRFPVRQTGGTLVWRPEDQKNFVAKHEYGRDGSEWGFRMQEHIDNCDYWDKHLTLRTGVGVVGLGLKGERRVSMPEIVLESVLRRRHLGFRRFRDVVDILDLESID